VFFSPLFMRIAESQAPLAGGQAKRDLFHLCSANTAFSAKGATP